MFREAEPIFREALAISEKVLGKEDPLIVIIIYNLVSLLF